ncbi:MAG: hypothetical protein AAGA93_14420 [Actinomycetota bacterium]
MTAISNGNGSSIRIGRRRRSKRAAAKAAEAEAKLDETEAPTDDVPDLEAIVAEEAPAERADEVEVEIEAEAEAEAEADSDAEIEADADNDDTEIDAEADNDEADQPDPDTGETVADDEAEAEIDVEQAEIDDEATETTEDEATDEGDEQTGDEVADEAVEIDEVDEAVETDETDGHDDEDDVDPATDRTDDTEVDDTDDNEADARADDPAGDEVAEAGDAIIVALKVDDEPHGDDAGADLDLDLDTDTGTGTDDNDTDTDTDTDVDDADTASADFADGETSDQPVELAASTAPETAPVSEPTTFTPTPPVPMVDAVMAANEFTTRQLGSMLVRAVAVIAVLAQIGFLAGLTRGATNVARAEFVYTLDQSVPDSFLREDRRLLTQVATFTSDAVLEPVSRQFAVGLDDLRAAIDIETVALSEVLRLEVTDADAGRALAINRAIVDQYLLVITDTSPAGDSRELTQRRDEVLADLAEADGQRQTIERTGEQDAVLAVRQDSIQRRIDLARDRIASLQGLVDDALIGAVPASRAEDLTAELDQATAELATLEGDLAAVVSERSDLVVATSASQAVDREIERLESQLNTIDDELSQRQLGPLVASPIRELSDPLVIERSAVRSGIQGAALGALIGLPIAAWVAYRTRRRQLWFV